MGRPTVNLGRAGTDFPLGLTVHITLSFFPARSLFKHEPRLPELVVTLVSVHNTPGECSSCAAPVATFVADRCTAVSASCLFSQVPQLDEGGQAK